MQCSFEQLVLESRKYSEEVDRLERQLEAKKSKKVVYYFLVASHISSRIPGELLQADSFSAAVPADARPKTLHELIFVGSDGSQQALPQLLGAKHGIELDSWRAMLHQGGDKYVEETLASKGISDAANQAWHIKIMLDLSLVPANVCGSFHDSYWPRKPWQKKLEDLSKVTAEQPMKRRRFLPSVTTRQAPSQAAASSLPVQQTEECSGQAGASSSVMAPAPCSWDPSSAPLARYSSPPTSIFTESYQSYGVEHASDWCGGVHQHAASRAASPRIESDNVCDQHQQLTAAGTDMEPPDEQLEAQQHDQEDTASPMQPGQQDESPDSHEAAGVRRSVRLLSLEEEKKMQGATLRYQAGLHRRRAKARVTCPPASDGEGNAEQAADKDEEQVVSPDANATSTGEEYQSMGTGPYLVDSASEVLRSLDSRGLAVLCRPGLKAALSPETIDEALRFSKLARPIFQSALEKDGEYVQEYDSSGAPTGFLLSHGGTNQRRSRLIDPSNPKHTHVLKDLIAEVEAAISEVLESDDTDLYLYKKPALLVNTQSRGQEPVPRQDWHTDLDEERRGFVAIAPVQEMTLLVYPGSNKIVMEYLRLEQLEKNGTISSSDLHAWTGMHKFKAVRLLVNPGEVLFLSGHTVHAGDRGTPHHPALRVHWYVVSRTEGDAKNDTKYLAMYGAALAACFQ